jgi:hypothetical protein
MVPAGMAIISNAYGAEQRALALGTLVGVSGVAQSMGPLLGGFLTAEVSWRWVFLHKPAAGRRDNDRYGPVNSRVARCRTLHIALTSPACDSGGGPDEFAPRP